MADLPAPAGISRKGRVPLAENVEEIARPKVLKGAVALFAAHPDPEVRHALAENDGAPRVALELLTQDADPERAAIARDKLEKA